MKTSRIIFSMVFIAGALISTSTMAQTRVMVNAGIVAPQGCYPHRGPVYYHPPRPVPPPCGASCDARMYRYHRYGHDHYNHRQYGHDHKYGRTHDRGQGRGKRNHSHHH